MENQAVDTKLNELVTKAQTGCKDAKEQVIARCEWIVNFQAIKAPLPESERDDAKQTGFIGLLNAIDTFDPERNSNFYNWAHMKVRFEIAGNNTGQNYVNISRYRRSDAKKYREALNHGLSIGLSIPEVDALFQKEHECSALKFQEIKTAYQLLSSNAVEFDTVQTEANAFDPEHSLSAEFDPVVNAEEVARCKAVMDSFEEVLSSESDPDMMGTLLKMRVMSDQTLSAEATGKELNMSAQTVLAHQKRLLANLRDHLKYRQFSIDNLLEV
ncbi:sigma-70 family RNA polymerase sigma factor [Photobacterium lutimaris]|uniref:RNA polymerase sigma-70 region 2 domain-containing protein n=1 Tax=Photobacterium lutimaris TaxID=388278 RepID=A0A2T3ITV0_9GAMM|nr:sigma factor [Photobacterium lutimaris]PSU31787.1 hypothetical protein C9I99_21625 [Photobacterium lutimaris]TDR72560.1 RNA polymerase sigma factor (sigma-70 family) [Photobacterium lutimaris]